VEFKLGSDMDSLTKINGKLTLGISAALVVLGAMFKILALVPLGVTVLLSLGTIGVLASIILLLRKAFT